MRDGLPLVPASTPASLVALDGVTARSVRPDDPVARLDALDKLLRRELRRLGLHELRPAAGLLFGITKGGTSLTERRRAAAIRSGYSLDHVRKRIEPRICEQLATQLYTDSLQYVQRRDDGQPFAASGDSPTISEDDIADIRDAEREALISRIWSDVFGLRADLILREGLRADPERRAEFEEAARGALWHLARLLTNLEQFVGRYGSEILTGSASFNAEGLIRLAGWTGDVTAEQARELRFILARTGEWNRSEFAGWRLVASSDCSG